MGLFIFKLCIASESQEPGSHLVGWSHSQCVFRFQSRCWPGLQAGEGLTGAGVPTSRTARSNNWQVAIGCGKEVSVPCHEVLSKGCLSILMTWQLPPEQVIRESKVKATVSYVLALEFLKHQPYGILVVAQVNPILCGKGIHRT